MAAPSVTYTFSNSTTADAGQVNQNFTDVINALTDGTKDFSISALTAGGTATLNGAVNLGNGTSKDISFLGSLASSIPIKTTFLYDLGTSTIGMKDIYFGSIDSAARATKIRAGTVASANTITLPIISGTLALASDDSGKLENFGIAASVAASALTIALKTKALTDATTADPIKIAFRSSTLTSGTYVERTVSASLSVVISSGSTLGATSANANWAYIYAIDNAGTVELAVSGTLLADEGSLVNTTAEGGAGAADDKYTLYSTTARTSVACRLLGRVKSTQATAGTWATSPSEVSLAPFKFAGVSQIIRGTVASKGGSSSGETTVVNYSAAVSSVGTDITFTARTTTSGDKYTINTDGIYAIWATGHGGSAGDNWGITVNSSGLSTNPQSLTATEVPMMSYIATGSTALLMSVPAIFLKAGDVVRIQSDGTPSGNANQRFGITKIC